MHADQFQILDWERNPATTNTSVRQGIEKNGGGRSFVRCHGNVVCSRSAAGSTSAPASYSAVQSPSTGAEARMPNDSLRVRSQRSESLIYV